MCCSSLWALLDQLPAGVRQAAAAVAIDGTSATALLLDAATGAQLVAPKLYNESQEPEIVRLVKVGTISRGDADRTGVPVVGALGAGLGGATGGGTPQLCTVL